MTFKGNKKSVKSSRMVNPKETKVIPGSAIPSHLRSFPQVTNLESASFLSIGELFPCLAICIVQDQGIETRPEINKSKEWNFGCNMKKN